MRNPWILRIFKALLCITIIAGIPLPTCSAPTTNKIFGISPSDIVQRAATLADLRALADSLELTDSAEQQVAYLEGRTTSGDGGEGIFRWNGNDLSAEVKNDTQSGIYVAPDSDPTGASGCWERQYIGPAHIKWFGAKGDGITDDTDAINASLIIASSVIFDNCTYYINGGSNEKNSSISGDSVNDGIKIPSNRTLDGNGALLVADAGGITATGSDQFRILTNDVSGSTSENITIQNFRIKHTGTEGYYTNGIWINGGPSSKPEHWVKNINIMNIYLENLRVGIVMRDNMPNAVPIATNDKRTISDVSIKKITAKNITSAVVAPDGDNIIIDGVVSDSSGAAESYDCISMVRGHNVFINNIVSKGLSSGYGVLIRNRTGANTQNVHVSNIRVSGGKGIKIGTDSYGTTEETSNIHLANIIVTDGALLIDKSVDTMIVKDIDVFNVFVSGGTTLDGLEGIGARVYANTTAASGVENVKINNLTIKNPSGIALEIRNSQGIKVSNFHLSRGDTTAALLKIIGNVKYSSFSAGVLDTGSVGIDIYSASSAIDAVFRDINILNTTTSIGSDSSEANDTIRIFNVVYDTANNYTPLSGSYVALLDGPGENLTINSLGAISITHEWHKVDTYKSAATDDLTTIQGGKLGQRIILSIVNNSRNIVVKHASDNIRTKAATDVTLDNTKFKIILQFDGKNWIEI